MDITVGTQNMCDLRFAIFSCDQPRTSFYTEPFHMCYYHGVETDLVNLTTYIGYELWKVSTTCGIFLESIRATSVIFFLGVGSLVCYKLYGYYKKKRRPRRYTLEKGILRRKTISSWVSRELLDSCLNREPELNDINKEYFGPVDCSDDEQYSSCSELGGNAAPLNSTKLQHSTSKLVTEESQCTSRVIRMGPSHSSGITKNAVVYNVRSGVSLINSLSPITSKPSKESNITQFELSGLSTSPYSQKYSYTLKAAPQSLPHQRPRSLPAAHHTRKKARTSHDHQQHDEVEHIFTLSMSSRGSRKSVDGDTDDDCSSKFNSDEEMMNDDGDDEEEDEHEKRSGSLVGNYSLQSLWNRRQEIGLDDDTILPQNLVDEHSRSPDVWDGHLKRKLPIFVMHSSRSVSMSDEDCRSEMEDQISFNTDLSPITSGVISGSRRSIGRDNSFGTVSEVSEISVDVSGFNNVGKQTESRINEIQKEIDDLKRDCLDIESHFGNVNAHGPTPTMYTELVKPSLSDISECSDLSASDCNVDGKKVDSGSLRRTVFKHHLVKSPSGGSADSSFDQPSANSSSSSANRSANLSLEWESMKCSEVNDVKLPKKPTAVVKLVNNAGDSGSDFGTPLTNCSPEPASITRGVFEKAESLEWDEEFNEHSKAEVCKLSQAEDGGRSSPVISGIDTRVRRKIAPPLYDELFLQLRLNCRNNSSNNLTCGVEAQSNKNMWSSMESGYIEEFTESGVSCLVTPLADEKAEKAFLKPNCAALCGHQNQLGKIRTWPVVGERMTSKQLCSSFHINSDFLRICCHLELKHFRPLHHDKYSILRATVLQMLIQGYSPLEQSGGVDHVKKTFSKWVRCHHKWLSQWCFLSDQPRNEDNCLRTMFDCLQSLDWMTGEVLSSANTETAAVKILNSDPEVELHVVEAAKLLMLKSTLELYETLSLDKAVPIFALRLFSRETSSNPEAFMHNHLNHTGSHQELEVMELFLLGYAMGVTICIITPGEDNKDDIMKYYPDCKLGLWPEVYLVRSEETGQLCVTLR